VIQFPSILRASRYLKLLFATLFAVDLQMAEPRLTLRGWGALTDTVTSARHTRALVGTLSKTSQGLAVWKAETRSKIASFFSL
jgi:hypothetical protein